MRAVAIFVDEQQKGVSSVVSCHSKGIAFRPAEGSLN